MNTKRWVKAEHPNGTVETRDYDKAGQLSLSLISVWGHRNQSSEIQL